MPTILYIFNMNFMVKSKLIYTVPILTYHSSQAYRSVAYQQLYIYIYCCVPPLSPS